MQQIPLKTNSSMLRAWNVNSPSWDITIMLIFWVRWHMGSKGTANSIGCPQGAIPLDYSKWANNYSALPDRDFHIHMQTLQLYLISGTCPGYLVPVLEFWSSRICSTNMLSIPLILRGNCDFFSEDFLQMIFSVLKIW